jgi:transposase
MNERMLTSKEIARHFKVSNSTARGWLLRGRIAGAELRQSELGQSYWVAPEGSVKTFTPPKPGPTPKTMPAANKRATGRIRAGNKASATKKKGGKK